jgi:hypothetical protein
VAAFIPEVSLGVVECSSFAGSGSQHVN